jgi:hypothetical protein
MNRSKRTAFGIAVLVLFLIAPTRAQDLEGRWSGRMEPKNLSAEIEIELHRTGTSWTGVMTFRAGPDGGPLPVE